MVSKQIQNGYEQQNTDRKMIVVQSSVWLVKRDSCVCKESMIERSFYKSPLQTQDTETLMSLLANTPPNLLFKNITKVHNKSKSKGFKTCIYMQTTCHSWWSLIILGGGGVHDTMIHNLASDNSSKHSMNWEVNTFKGETKSS